MILVMTECGYGKRVSFSEFSPHGRATGGQKIYTISEKTGEIVGLVSVLDTDEVVCITSQGKTLRVKADSISTMGRAAQGVRILNIERPDSLIGMDTVAQEDEEKLSSSEASVVSIAGELDLDGTDDPEDEYNEESNIADGDEPSGEDD